MTGSTIWFIVAAVAFVAAAAIYFINAPHRKAVDKAVASPAAHAKALKFLDLCGGAPSDLANRNYGTPERLACYDRSYLMKFAERARQTKTDLGDTGLDRFLNIVLLRHDVAFAIAMAIAVACLGFGLFLIGHGTMKWLAAASACLGLIYGATDIGEDVLLVRILRNPQGANEQTVALANWLTRAKLASLTLSVSGGIAFGALQATEKLLKR